MCMQMQKSGRREVVHRCDGCAGARGPGDETHLRLSSTSGSPP